MLGRLLYCSGSTLGSVFGFCTICKKKKNLVSYSLWMPDGYIAGEVMRDTDRLSRYCATTVIAPLLPKLLVEHQWSKKYDCTVQSVCAVCFSHSRFNYSDEYCGEEGMFYCTFGSKDRDKYLSGGYTCFEFSGNHFSLLFEPRRMAAYNARYYGRRGNFPCVCVDVLHEGETVGLWFKSCTRDVQRRHPSGLWCTYSLQSW